MARKTRWRLPSTLAMPRMAEPFAWPPSDLASALSSSGRAALKRFQTMVDPHDPAEVTRRGEESPTHLDVDAIWRDVEALYATGLHPAVALNIRHKGEVVLDRTIGHLEHEPGQTPTEVVTPDTLFNLFSGSKIVTAVAIHALAEDGGIDLEDRVVKYLPDFHSHGKDRIRIRHLLNHTAGIPDMPGEVDVEAFLERGEIPWDKVWAVKPLTRAGRNVAYHPMTSWFLLERILQDRTGRDLRTYLQERILAPLGFERMNYGVPAHLVDRVAKHVVTGPPVPAPAARIFERTIGVPLDKAIRVVNGEAALTAILPSANIIATPREATRFMQMLLQGGELDGVRVLKQATVDRMVTDVTPRQLDSTFGFPVRYGLGVMMGGLRFSLFGLNTRGAFGHLGLSNVVVYADPARDLSVAFLNTGKPIIAPGMVRWYWVLQRIALMVPRR